MDSERVELPSALLRAPKLDDANVSDEAARLLALDLYREDKVSLSRAAELRKTPLAAFVEFVAKHGVPPLRFAVEDLEEERSTVVR